MVPWTWFVKLCVWLELDMIMSNNLLYSSCKAKRLEQRNFFFNHVNKCWRIYWRGWYLPRIQSRNLQKYAISGIWFFSLSVPEVWDETNGVLASWPFKSYEWPSQNFSLQYQYNINTISRRWVMGTKKNIRYGIISWSNAKFLELTSSELYGSR